MPSSLATYKTVDRVGIVSMNRPDKLNALNAELKAALAERLAEADSDPSTSVLVLRGEGRSFCAGYDIAASPEQDARRYDALKWHAHLTQSLRLEMTPWEMRKPVIASVQGHALGGGCELAMLCDLTIAADNAVFGEPEIRFSNSGPALIMPFVIGPKRARELLYFGDTIDAQTALAWGMINRVVPLADLLEATMKYARRLALIDPEALVATKLGVKRGAEAAGLRAALQAGLDVVAPLYAARTEMAERFEAIAKTQGLGAALKWRMGQFAE